jgi:hypothetical protein
MDFIHRLVSQPSLPQNTDKELKTPKRPKYKPQNNKPEQTHTQNIKPEYINGNKTTRRFGNRLCFRPHLNLRNIGGEDGRFRELAEDREDHVQEQCRQKPLDGNRSIATPLPTHVTQHADIHPYTERDSNPQLSIRVGVVNG